jgi:hypothetical protein
MRNETKGSRATTPATSRTAPASAFTQGFLLKAARLADLPSADTPPSPATASGPAPGTSSPPSSPTPACGASCAAASPSPSPSSAAPSCAGSRRCSEEVAEAPRRWLRLRLRGVARDTVTV